MREREKHSHTLSFCDPHTMRERAASAVALHQTLLCTIFLASKPRQGLFCFQFLKYTCPVLHDCPQWLSSMAGPSPKSLKFTIPFEDRSWETHWRQDDSEVELAIIKSKRLSKAWPVNGNKTQTFNKFILLYLLERFIGNLLLKGAQYIYFFIQ